MIHGVFSPFERNFRNVGDFVYASKENIVTDVRGFRDDVYDFGYDLIRPDSEARIAYHFFGMHLAMALDRVTDPMSGWVMSAQGGRALAAIGTMGLWAVSAFDYAHRSNLLHNAVMFMNHLTLGEDGDFTPEYKKFRNPFRV